MINKYLVVIVFLVLASTVNSQVKKETEFIGPGFKSLQLDVTTSIFTVTFSGCVDVDLLTDKQNNYASGGFRVGADYYSKGSPGGPERGSPYFDIDALARGTLDTKYIRTDLYIGGTYHTEKNETTPFGPGAVSNSVNGIYIKFGADLKVKLYKNYVGLIGKFAYTQPQSYGGLGIFFGYGE